MENPASQTIYRKDYQPFAYQIPKIELRFDLSAEKTLVSSTLEILRRSSEPVPLYLDGENLELLELRVDGEQYSDYEVNDKSLILPAPPERFSLTIETRCSPANNTALVGLYASSGNLCTQCEAEGFRRITYYPDRPDVLSRYSVELIADKSLYPVLLCNGNKQDAGEIEDNRHWTRWVDPFPKPCYLFALVAGRLASIHDQFTTMSGRTVDLAIYTQKQYIDRCDHAISSLKRAMRWDETNYGREYDLDVFNIVAVDDFNAGAMENKGLNIFNAKYVLASRETATDDDYDAIESVIGHEYFHNWSGNRVTCRDWFQLSLKEGLTVYRDQQFSADMGSAEVKRIQGASVIRNLQFKEDSGPLSHPVRPESYEQINNFYTLTIYEKGAELIRMLQLICGEAGFRRGTDLYFSRYDGKAATIEDFLSSLEIANELDLTQFRRWYVQAGTPQVQVDESYDAEKRELRLSFKQNPGGKTTLPIPIALRVFDQQGNTQYDALQLVNKEAEIVNISNIEEPACVAYLRHFSAPVKLNVNRSAEQLIFLVKTDSDGFTRWDAMQQLALSCLQASYNKSGSEIDSQSFADLHGAFSECLSQGNMGPALTAELLALPSAAFFAEQQKQFDPHRVVAVHRALRKRLGEAFSGRLTELFEYCNSTLGSTSKQEVGLRALKARTLDLLLANNNRNAYSLAQTLYHDAGNMTDRMNAFRSLVHSMPEQSGSIIEDFLAHWKNDPGVMDKWLTVQASVPAGDTFQRVRELTKHPSFTVSNPNKVYSLLGVFAHNLCAFHRSDGAAYNWQAQQIAVIDEINPQIAARLATAFESWTKLVLPYRDGMRASLQALSSNTKLSSDLREIVHKTLGS